MRHMRSIKDDPGSAWQHSVTTWILVGLISLHALAGLKHLLIDRDGVFQRM